MGPGPTFPVGKEIPVISPVLTVRAVQIARPMAEHAPGGRTRHCERESIHIYKYTHMCVTGTQRNLAIFFFIFSPIFFPYFFPKFSLIDFSYHRNPVQPDTADIPSASSLCANSKKKNLKMSVSRHSCLTTALQRTLFRMRALSDISSAVVLINLSLSLSVSVSLSLR